MALMSAQRRAENADHGLKVEIDLKNLSRNSLFRVLVVTMMTVTAGAANPSVEVSESTAGAEDRSEMHGTRDPSIGLRSFLLTLAIGIQCALGSDQPRATKQYPQEVFVSPKGECYHTKSACPGLNNASQMHAKGACRLCSQHLEEGWQASEHFPSL